MNPIYYVIIVACFALGSVATVIAVKVSKKNKIKRNYNNLKTKYKNVSNSNLDAKINKLKSISENNKEYVDVYNEVNEKFKEIVDTYSLGIEAAITKIDVLFSDKDYKTAKESLLELENTINTYAGELNKIDANINEVTSKEDELREIVVPLKEQFRQLKASFYEHKEELSICSKIFEKKINELEKTVVKLDNKLENAYYKDAEELINELQTEVNFYEGHLAKMPEIVSFSMQVLPKRLETAMNNYKKMKDEGYPLFSIKASAMEEKIKASLDEIKIRFEQFNYEDINDSIKEVVYDIENLNELLEKEVTAKDHFNKYIDTVYENIDEINKKFLKVKRDTSTIKGVYLFDENRYTELGTLETQIHILNRIKMELDAYIHSATKQPYSILTNKMGELAEFGGEVEDKLNDYQNYILSLKNDSEYSYEKVNNYSLEITTIFNTLKGLNHKVLSTMYEDEYNYVCNIIQNINKSLKTKPINVEYVNENCKNLTNVAEKLLLDMKNSLKMYNMAQNIIIFTNKYRSSFSTVNEVLNRAQVHFENGEFEFAIDSVSEVLQEVHPKAYEEMMRRKGNKDD